MPRDGHGGNTVAMTAQSRPPILVTRPEPQAERFARALRAQDWAGRVHVSPLMAAVYPPLSLPARPFDAVILTSETTALAAGRRPDLPRKAWCVGNRTARAARAQGFQAVSARGDADALVQMILARGGHGPLVYLHGRETRGAVAERLNSAGIETIPVLAYAQEPCPLRPAAIRLLRQPGPVILPILSPRSAALLCQAWVNARAVAQAHVVVLSPAIAQAAEPLRPASVTLATRPDGESLLAALKQLMRRAPWA